MHLSTGRIVVSLLVIDHMATERSAFFVDALLEQLGGREPPLLVEVVDLTDELAAERMKSGSEDDPPSSRAGPQLFRAKGEISNGIVEGPQQGKINH